MAKTPELIDIRPVPSPKRHLPVAAAARMLDSGDSFVLITDADPAPIYRQLGDARQSYTWNYMECGPGTWCVRIIRI